MPNFSDWRAGDIVLVEAIGFVGGVIQAGQMITTNPLMAAGSQWSHAAIYIGNGMVVDATWGAGITAQSLWTYCQSREVTLRRIDDPSIPAADIQDIAKYAASHIGEPYSAIQALLAKLGWSGAQTPNPSALYCSTFAGLVVTEATGVDLSSDPIWQPLYPAMLASHSELVAVPLEWRNI